MQIRCPCAVSLSSQLFGYLRFGLSEVEYQTLLPGVAQPGHCASVRTVNCLNLTVIQFDIGKKAFVAFEQSR